MGGHGKMNLNSQTGADPRGSGTNNMPEQAVQYGPALYGTGLITYGGV
jgi:hypothetical protein